MFYRPYKCLTIGCSKEYYRKHELQKHIEKHHSSFDLNQFMMNADEQYPESPTYHTSQKFSPKPKGEFKFQLSSLSYEEEEEEENGQQEESD